MRLVIVSHVAHYRWQGSLHAYAPYAREIDIWADLFSEVVIAAPLREEAPPGDATPFTRSNIGVHPVREAGGESIAAKLGLALALPVMVFDLCRALSRADAIHVRCPGNLGLLGALLAPLFSRRLIAKYAGQWSPYEGEALTVRLQRAILRSRWFAGPVTVYGHWPSQPEHIIPFFTSVLNDEHLERGRRAALARRKNETLRIVFSGRLSASKKVDVLLRALALVRSEGVGLEAVILGDGPKRAELEALAAELGIAAAVDFRGGVSYDQVFEALESADILTLVSETEGWPKALAEGMSFGLICIGSNRGWVPEMLAEGRGFLVEPGDVDGLAAALRRIAADPAECDAMRARALEWVSGYSLEGLRDAIRALMIRHWNLPETALPQFERPLLPPAGAATRN